MILTKKNYSKFFYQIRAQRLNAPNMKNAVNMLKNRFPVLARRK